MPFVFNPDNPSAQASARLAREGAKGMGIQLTERHVRTLDELRAAVHGVKSSEYDAFFQISDATVTANSRVIIDGMREKRLPMMSHETSLCDKGALFCYGPNYGDIGRQAGKFVQRILAGTSPKDLPVENYSKIELALNLRTAKQIGVSFSQPILLRADRVIE